MPGYLASISESVWQRGARCGYAALRGETTRLERLRGTEEIEEEQRERERERGGAVAVAASAVAPRPRGCILAAAGCCRWFDQARIDRFCESFREMHPRPLDAVRGCTWRCRDASERFALPAPPTFNKSSVLRAGWKPARA